MTDEDEEEIEAELAKLQQEIEEANTEDPIKLPDVPEDPIEEPDKFPQVPDHELEPEKQKKEAVAL